jgi:hypothetical protein
MQCTIRTNIPQSLSYLRSPRHLCGINLNPRHERITRTTRFLVACRRINARLGLLRPLPHYPRNPGANILGSTFMQVINVTQSPSMQITPHSVADLDLNRPTFPSRMYFCFPVRGAVQQGSDLTDRFGYLPCQVTLWWQGILAELGIWSLSSSTGLGTKIGNE